MFNSAFTTATGIQGGQAYLDVTSNNVANSGTIGYKTGQITFQDLLYQTLVPPGALLANGNTTPTGLQLGNGTSTGTVTGLFTQGTLTPTGNPLDVAIQGDGFLQITLPDGTTGYTRAGSLTVNSAGQLQTATGLLVSPGIDIPPDAISTSIASDGTVTVTTPAGSRNVGQLQLARFVNEAGLLRIGQTEFAETSASGPPTTGTPGTNGLGTITQGSLEQSNVDLTTELVNLIIAQRTVSLNAQALTVENTVMGDTTALIA